MPEDNLESFNEDSEEDDQEDHILLGVTGELEMRDYSQTGTVLDEKGRLALVADSTGKEKVVRKGGICWYLNKNRCKLSSDRLKRVMEKDFQNTGKNDPYISQ